MKKILVHINTFIMFVLTIIFILFIEFQIELRPNNIITNLEKLLSKSLFKCLTKFR